MWITTTSTPSRTGEPAPKVRAGVSIVESRPVSGSVGGRGEYQLEEVIRDQINLAARAPHRKKNKVASCLCDFLLV